MDTTKTAIAYTGNDYDTKKFIINLSEDFLKVYNMSESLAEIILNNIGDKDEKLFSSDEAKIVEAFTKSADELHLKLKLEVMSQTDVEISGDFAFFTGAFNLPSEEEKSKGVIFTFDFEVDPKLKDECDICCIDFEYAMK